MHIPENKLKNSNKGISDIERLHRSIITKEYWRKYSKIRSSNSLITG